MNDGGSERVGGCLSCLWRVELAESCRPCSPREMILHLYPLTVDPQELTSQSSGPAFQKHLGQDALGRVLLLRGCSPSTSQGLKKPQAWAVGDWWASQKVTRSSLTP